MNRVYSYFPRIGLIGFSCAKLRCPTLLRLNVSIKRFFWKRRTNITYKCTLWRSNLYAHCLWQPCPWKIGCSRICIAALSQQLLTLMSFYEHSSKFIHQSCHGPWNHCAVLCLVYDGWKIIVWLVRMPKVDDFFVQRATRQKSWHKVCVFCKNSKKAINKSFEPRPLFRF